MIITCESCATQFQLESSRIPAEGIRVRCSICKHAFFVENHEAATGDPVDRAVGRALADDAAGGVPGVAQDLGEGGGRFEQSFEAARSAVDELLGFASPAPAGRPPEAPPAPPAPPAELAELAELDEEAEEAAADEIVFDVEEELAAAQAATPLPEADPFAQAQDPGPVARQADPWEAPPPREDGPAALDEAFAADSDAGPHLDPWDTPLPDEGPADLEHDAAEPDADPWDTPVPVEDSPPAQAAPALAAPAAVAEPIPLGGGWEEGWEPAPLEADEPEALGEPGLGDLATPAPSDEPAAVEAEAPTEPEDELEEALKLGWGGSTDTVGIELADAGGAASSADGTPLADAEDAGWGDLHLDAEPARAGHSAAAAGRAAPAIGFGARLGAPRARRIVAWLAGLGEGAGWSIVAGLAAVLLWASLAPRAATEEPAATLAIAGLEASGIAGRWVENALAGPVLVVSGELRNAGPAARRPAARLVVRLLDADGAPLDGVPTSVGLPLDRERLREASAAELRQAREASAQALARAELAPGEAARFEAVILAVPEAAGRFEVATETTEPGRP